MSYDGKARESISHSGTSNRPQTIDFYSENYGYSAKRHSAAGPETAGIAANAYSTKWLTI
ncbi:hypothetical protein [Aestuariivita boseongensis]|uniref:hypothetical protein n=1 Tax=Aestuariivita boseongensis TaxID=1470562 RepID=UPI000680DB01|nr:hypothetical protein [Aestuariivita boseongensis]